MYCCLLFFDLLSLLNFQHFHLVFLFQNLNFLAECLILVADFLLVFHGLFNFIYLFESSLRSLIIFETKGLNCLSGISTVFQVFGFGDRLCEDSYCLAFSYF
jgi:energy-converting hydrogenase Eha subunit G